MTLRTVDEKEFTHTSNIANDTTEAYYRTVTRGTVDVIIPNKPFHFLVYGYETTSKAAADASVVVTLTFAATKGVANHPYLGTATRATDEIYVWENSAATSKGTLLTQLDDGSTPAEGQFALATDRKSVKMYHTTGTASYFFVYYLLNEGVVRLDVKNSDKAIRREIMVWRINQLNTVEYVDAREKTYIPNTWVTDEKRHIVFSIKAPVVIDNGGLGRLAGGVTAWTTAALGAKEGYTKLSLLIRRLHKANLTPADAALIETYNSLLR